MTSLVSAAEIPPLLTNGDIATLLGVKTSELTWWIWGLSSERRYTRFEISKRSGDFRTIDAPIKPIKDMQRRLADVLLEVYEPKAHVHGFVAGRSPRTNAEQHQGQRWLLKLDLEDFFPQIHFGRVRGLFMSRPFEYPADVATTLAQLCSHEGRLPQGAPTSPIISNFICRGLDAELARLARTERCRFTRYADDICFSTNRTQVPAAFAKSGPLGDLQLGDRLVEIIHNHGFKVNASKTRLVRRSRRQRVTGLVVNSKVNVPVDYVRSLRNLLFIWERHGEDDAIKALARHEPSRNRAPGRGTLSFRLLVRGRVQYVGSVKGWSNQTYRNLALTLERLDPDFHPRTVVSLKGAQRIRVYTEGESDPLHLRAAHRYFVDRGEFTKLELEFLDDASAGGDTKLLKKLEDLAVADQEVPCICVFDHDNQEVIRKAVGSTPFRRRGDNVAAVLVSPPEWRTDQRVCIEMLYQNGDLARRGDEDRRLYLAEEFHPRNGQHVSEPGVYVPHPDGDKVDRKLIREEVFQMGVEGSVGLSKMAFGQNVEGRAKGFEDVDFEGFRRTFEHIEEAVVRLISS